jgi:hypothetical protein
MSSITITARELTSLVGPVLPHASKDGSLPLLASILIRSNGPWLTAIATDRYRMGFKRIKPATAPGEDFAVALPLAILARIRSVFAANRVTDPEITLTIDGTKLHVTSTGALDGLIGASLDFHLMFPAKDFPKIDRILRGALTAELPTGPSVMPVNPHLLADFRLGHDRNPQMTVTRGGEKMWLIRIGADFLGVIVALNYGTGDFTEAERGDWAEMLAAPVEPVVAVAA